MGTVNTGRGRLTGTTLKYVCLLSIFIALITSFALPNSVAASQSELIFIHTTKPLGPALGQFSTSGAFSDSGVLVTEQRIVSALPSPFGVITHLVLRFEGQYGTFTIRTDIIETVTADPAVFANKGRWVIINGTGAYATLYGTGEVEGTVDDRANLITRDYTGQVHFE